MRVFKNERDIKAKSNIESNTDFIAPIWQSNKSDGDMGVSGSPSRARGLFLERIGISPARCWVGTQVHGHTIAIVDAHTRVADMPPADGLITSLAGVALAVTVADCIPIFVGAPGVVGILHSGRRSTGIVVEAILRLRNVFGLTANQLHLHVGAGIGACCYEIDHTTAEEFRTLFRTYSYGTKIPSEVLHARGSRYMLDLPRANILLARQYGVRNISYDPRCSCCDSSLFSYRREGNRFGHMMAIIYNRYQ